MILTHPVSLPTERILTSGCGGGITFRIDHRLFPRLSSGLRVSSAQLAARMRDLFAAAVLYKASRGIHGAALCDGDGLLLVAEDVGRHNAVDKIKGEALLRGIRPRTVSCSPRDGLVEMLQGRAHGATSWPRAPTDRMAVGLGRAAKIPGGYVRPDDSTYAATGVLGVE